MKNKRNRHQIGTERAIFYDSVLRIVQQLTFFYDIMLGETTRHRNRDQIEKKGVISYVLVLRNVQQFIFILMTSSWEK